MHVQRHPSNTTKTQHKTKKGYFAYDTAECLLRFEHEGPEFLLHGVFCFVVFTSLTHLRLMHWYGAGFLMWELSTPFMHLRWVLYKMAKDKGALYAANGAAGMLTFFLCRVVWGPVISALFWRVRCFFAREGGRKASAKERLSCTSMNITHTSNNTKQNKTNQSKKDSLAALAPSSPLKALMPFGWITLYRSCTGIMNGLNFYWFSKMVKLAAAARGSGKAGASAHAREAEAAAKTA
jgi:hypothetical protein